MIEEAKALFFAPLRNKEHRRRQQAAGVFAVLWALSILFTITTSFLLITVQSLVLLNITVSLASSVITQALCSRAGTQQTYPFVFGFYRLATVMRLGGVVFVVFGCLTTIVESLHRGMHVHHSNPYYLLCVGAVQLAFQCVYRHEVRLCDRVTGHRGMAGQQCEDLLFQASAASPSEGRVVGGGDFFKSVGDGSAGGPPSPSALTAAAGGGGGGGGGGAASSAGGRLVHSRAGAMLLYLLCPLVCIAVSVLLVITDSAVLDTVAALLLAAHYGYTGYREGRVMLDLLMNKSVVDARRNRSLERCLRNVKMLDGVLQVQSTVWWNINVGESMLLLRIRLMSGCDACVVSQAVRRQVADLATRVYVECFPANGADGGFGESAPLSWGSSAAQGHGHSHDHEHSHSHSHSHGHSHHHHDAHEHDHDHGHSHSHHHHHEDVGERGTAEDVRRDGFTVGDGGSQGSRLHANGVLPNASHYEASAAPLSAPNQSTPASPFGAPASSYGSAPPSHSHAASPPGAAGVPVMPFPAAPVSGSPPGQGFAGLPAPPYAASMPYHNNSNHHSHGDDHGHHLHGLRERADVGNGRGYSDRGSSAPSFPQAPSGPYPSRKEAVNVTGAAAQPGLQSGLSLGASGAFPQPPSVATRRGDVPPPVFTPFRPAEDQRRKSSSGAHDV